MSSDLAQSPSSQLGQQSVFQARIKTVRAIFQGLGAIVCILFAVQGVAVFTDSSEVTDFWQGCHWVSEGLLCICMGLGGFLLEVRLFFPAVRQHFARFAVNRLGVALVYLWVGCYSMGGPVQASDEWRAVGKATGIVAWFVGLVDALTSCCSDRGERLDRSCGQASGPIAVRPRDPDTSRYGVTTTPDEEAVEPQENPFADDEPVGSATDAGQQKNPFADDAPAGGWSSIGGGKPFGAC